MSKTVFICQVFHPDDQATSQLFSDLLVQLAGRGHEYEVLAGFPRQSSGADCPHDESWRGLRILRGGLRLDYRRSLLARAVGYASYCLWVAWRLVFCTSAHSRVLVVTNPPFAPVLVYACSRLRGWSYDVMLLDVYPDGLVALGKLAERSLVTRLWRRCNRRTLAAARQVLVLGRDMWLLCTQRYAIPPAHLRYAPHWSPVFSPARIPAPNTQLWRQLGLRDEFVIQYSGNMGLWHDIECIVRTAEQLRGEPHIRFLMIGGGMRRAAAEELAGRLELANMQWLPYQPHDQLKDSLSCSHATIISQRAGLEGVAVPCKLYGILASGRAILAQVPAASEVAQVIAEEDCGFRLEPGDAAGLAQAIRLLAAQPGRTEEMGRHAFAAYQRKYTVEKAADLFESTLHGMRGLAESAV